jgi:hypothetical protein
MHQRDAWSFAQLHAVTVRDTVSFHNVWSHFDDKGVPTSTQGWNGAAKTMLDQLAWWVHTLCEASTGRPYAA